MSCCVKCGNELAAGGRFCKYCGSPVAAAPASSIVRGPQPASGKAIASMILGFFFFLLPMAIAAIILGHMSLSEIRKNAGQLKGQGMAITGLVLGYLGVAGLPLILIIAAIAIPNVLRARIAANESSAAGVVRAINAAEMAFASANPNQGYTCRLSDLHEIMGPEVAAGQKHGYVFELSGCAPEAPGGANVKYQIVAYPAQKQQTGARAFCSDDSTEIRFDANGSARACLENGVALP